MRQGFSPGEGAPGVTNPPIFPDATDQLLESAIRDAPSDVRGMLILADGTSMKECYSEPRASLRENLFSRLEWQVIRKASQTPLSPAKC